MTLASTNRTQLVYMPETNFGEIPTTGNPYALRYTGETLTFGLTKENDKEINANAQLTSSTTTGAQADGDVKVHMQYAEYARFLAGVMRNTWTEFGTNGVGDTFSGTATATTLQADAATGTSDFTHLQAGQWFMLDAPGSTNDGKVFRVASVESATHLTVDASTPLADMTSVALCKISSARLSNGTTLQSFTIEKQMLDIGQFQTFRGMYVSKFSTSFASKALTEGTFTFLGKDMLVSGTGQTVTTTRMPGSVTASQTYDIQNAVTGVGNIWEGGAPLAGTFIKSMSLDIDSALRAQDAIGTLGLVGVGIGTFMAKGTLEVYFADGAMFNKFLNDTYTSITVSTRDTDGNGYVFTMPHVMLTSAKVTAGSKDADLMASFEYTAYGDMANADPALRKALFIDSVGAPVTP